MATRKKKPDFESSVSFRRRYAKFSVNSGNITGIKSFSGFSGGVPLMYYKEEGQGKVVIDASDAHTLCFGATGSKKTRSIVLPSVRILSCAGESLIINDPKGEIYSKTSVELQSKGYKIIVLNFRNPSIGNSWNPFAIPYRHYIDGDYDTAAELINDISNNLMTADLTVKDPYWQLAASDMFFGLALLLFKYCKEHNIPEEDVNIDNLIKLRRIFFSKRRIESTVLWKYAQEDELIAASLSGSVFNAESTRGCILGVFDQKIRTFVIQHTLMDMLSHCDFNMDDICDSKAALFLITPDEKSSYHRLVSLFIKQSYEYIIDKAQQNDGKVKNRVNYILDEFGTLPAIADMCSMISAARSRDIRFLLISQSKHQLIQRYGDDAQTIMANCSNWIYLGSREYDLLVELSDLCGENSKHEKNITAFELQHLNKDQCEALIISGRMKPIRVTLLDIDMYYRANDKNRGAIPIPNREESKYTHLDFQLAEGIKKRVDPDDDDDLF